MRLTAILVEPAAAPGQAGSAFRLYAIGLGAWYFAFGIGMVLVPWIAIEAVQASAEGLGVVQMCAMAPTLMLLLLAGVVVDRGDARKQLFICQALAALPIAALLLVAHLDQLSLMALMAYGVATGTVSAFAVPAREALLPRVADTAIPKAVAAGTSIQFSLQLAGIATATMTDSLGMVTLLGIQAAAMLVGAIAVWHLRPKAPPPARRNPPATLQSLRDGLRVARRSAEIWPVLVLIFGVGLFYVATFFVVLPIVVHDVYGGGAARLAAVTFVLWLGIIAASVGMRHLMADLQRRGRALVIAFGCGVILLLALAALPPFPVFLGLAFLWGATQGDINTQGRTIVQVAAPPDYRGRLLALFQLCYLGSTPLGAPLLGLVAGSWGPSTALWAAGAGVAITIATVATASTIWRQVLSPAEA